MTPTTQADRDLAATLDETFPIPDNPHGSVIQRAMEARYAFERGWRAARSQTSSLPAGWVAVPEEPTPTMSAKGFCVAEAEHDPSGVYRAMIAAAPPLLVQVG